MSGLVVRTGQSGLLRKQQTLICSVTPLFSRRTAGIKAGAGYIASTGCVTVPEISM